MGAQAATVQPDHLPERDEAYLDSKGLQWELRRESDGLWLVIVGFRFDVGRFDREALAAPGGDGKQGTDDEETWESALAYDSLVLAIMIPAQYPQAKLDMFWVWPHLRVKGTSSYPDRATCFGQHLGHNFQRFSRHLPNWRPNVDGLPGYLSLITKILNGG